MRMYGLGTEDGISFVGADRRQYHVILERTGEWLCIDERNRVIYRGLPTEDMGEVHAIAANEISARIR